MSRFSRLKDPNQVELIPEHERRVLLCQAFLKASDISNPVRLATFEPMHDSNPGSSAPTIEFVRALVRRPA